MRIIKNNLQKAIIESNPDLIIYNAETDILKDDPVGGLDISPEGVIERDELAFRYAKEENIPICMLLSGGYTKESPKVIIKSIDNLIEKGFIPIIED